MEKKTGLNVRIDVDRLNARQRKPVKHSATNKIFILSILFLILGFSAGMVWLLPSDVEEAKKQAWVLHLCKVVPCGFIQDKPMFAIHLSYPAHKKDLLMFNIELENKTRRQQHWPTLLLTLTDSKQEVSDWHSVPFKMYADSVNGATVAPNQIVALSFPIKNNKRLDYYTIAVEGAR